MSSCIAKTAVKAPTAAASAKTASSSSVQSDLCVLNGTTSCTASPGAPPHRAVSCKAGMVTAVGSPQPRESRRSAYTRWTKSLHGRASFASTAGPATGRASDIRSGGAVANPADTPPFLFFQVRVHGRAEPGKRLTKLTRPVNISRGLLVQTKRVVAMETRVAARAASTPAIGQPPLPSSPPPSPPPPARDESAITPEQRERTREIFDGALPNLSPSSSALPATDSRQSSYYESATRWFGRVLTSPSLATGETNEGEQSSVQSPATQEIVGEELPVVEGIVVRAVLSPWRALSSAVSFISGASGASDREEDPLPASLIFGDSTEPQTSSSTRASTGAGGASSGSAETVPTEAPAPAAAAAAEAGGRSSDASPQPVLPPLGEDLADLAARLHPNVPNGAEGIRDDSGSRSPGNDIVAEVTDIVAEVSQTDIGTDSDGGGGGLSPPSRQPEQRPRLGATPHLPSGEDLMYAKPSEVTAEAERRAGTASVLREAPNPNPNPNPNP